MKKILSLALCLFVSATVQAAAAKKAPAHIELSKNYVGFVSINAKKELYVEYLAPQENRPTVILLNGLTYSTRQWDAMTVFLKKAGLGVLRYDMSGMGKTLLKYGQQLAPYSYADQVSELDQLLTTVGLEKPYNLVGLSYGGGIAAAYAIQYPDQIKNAILMAPYTAPIENQDKWIKGQVTMTRAMFPFNAYSDDDLYDYFLKQIVYTTYPLLEPVVLENPYKLEATFRLTQGIRKFNVISKVAGLPKHAVHLVIAEKDQYIPRPVLQAFWNAIPVSARASLTMIANSEHKMPEAAPEESARVVDTIVSK